MPERTAINANLEELYFKYSNDLRELDIPSATWKQRKPW